MSTKKDSNTINQENVLKQASLRAQYPKLDKLYQLLENATALNQYELIAQCFDDIGEALFSFGEFDLALQYFKEKQVFFQSKEDFYKDYLFRIKTAKVLLNKDLIEASLDKLFEVLAFNAEELNAYAFNLLATICLMQNERGKGDSYLIRSTETHKRLAKKNRLAENKLVRGVYYKQEGDFIRALQYFNESLLLNRSIDNNYGESFLLMSCGDLFMEIKQFKEATRIYRDAFHIANKEQYGFIYIKCRIGFAESLMYDGNTFLAQEIFKETQLQCQEKAFRNLELQSLEGLEYCYQQEGKLVESPKNQKAIHLLQNRIKKDKDSAILDILAEKEKELKALLVQQNALTEQKKDLEQLKYALAHDLKEPLRNIGNYAGLIRNKYGDTIGKEGEEYIQIINQATSKLDRLMTGMLQYLSLGVLEVKFEDCNVNELIFEVIQDIESIIGKAKATIEFDIPITIYADYKSISKVFKEVIFNAIKFAKKDQQPIIKVRYEQTNGKTIFYISDNGIGIEKDYLKKILKLFYKLDRDPTDKGIGLGLANCNKITKLHGGTFSMDSTIGQGTTVSFSINNYAD